MSKQDLPSIQDELQPRKRVDLKSIRSSQLADDTVVENSKRLGADWGAQTSIEQPIERGPIASLRIEVPEYLDRELAFKAVELRTTKQYLVIKALQEAGYRVEDVDLVEDRRKIKRR
jgi:hypothetical protein